MIILCNRIIRINNHRTSMRLCRQEWDALNEICKTEKMSRNHLIELINNHKENNIGLAYATRVFALSYYRQKSANSLTDIDDILSLLS